MRIGYKSIRRSVRCLSNLEKFQGWFQRIPTTQGARGSPDGRGTGSSFRSFRRVVAGSYQTWSLVPAKRGSAHSPSVDRVGERARAHGHGVASESPTSTSQPREPPAEGLERVRILSRHFEMISGDFEVQEIDASMDGMEEAAGKFEMSPELNG